jgi:hypothetical protein
MSHLSILPTVFRDADTLMRSLQSLGFQPVSGGWVGGFAKERQAVAVSVELADGQRLGCQHQADGRLALVADLQQVSRSNTLRLLLGRLTRAYAAFDALRQAAADPDLASASVVLHP